MQRDKHLRTNQAIHLIAFYHTHQTHNRINLREETEFGAILYYSVFIFGWAGPGFDELFSH